MAETPAVRVRMAPGPTGPFHIGRTRTALLNWLFARHHGGTFVLRIEDTDQKRSRPEHLQSILDSLRWLNLTWDEGPDVGGPYPPYFQMGRLSTYQECAESLLRAGNAYTCYCTSAELDALREEARREHRAFRYPRTCRYLSDEQRAAREAMGLSHVVRLAVPDEGATGFDDLVLGPIQVDNSEIDDFVIVKSDGIPTYNFAVVVDDVTMEISHVIRGQDHVPNTPRQILVYNFLGKKTPAFAHVPLVVGMDRGKISARHGAEAVVAYGDDGFLPESIINYLATLGASYPEEREIFSPEELVEAFDLSHFGKASPVWNEEKLEWMNGVHIRSLSLDEFVERSLPFLQLRGLISSPPTDEELLRARRALALEQTRVRTLGDTPSAVEFFLQEKLAYDPATLVQKKSSPEEASLILAAVARILQEAAPSFSASELEPMFRHLTDELGLKTGTVFGTVRVAVTGRTAAPGLFETLEVLGRDTSLARVNQAIESLRGWE
ncbi:MAG TPA: glutamate--tRNA ligase [Chloroflexota bacterium]